MGKDPEININKCFDVYCRENSVPKLHLMSKLEETDVNCHPRDKERDREREADREYDARLRDWERHEK